MPDDVRLLPCPFCGEEAKIVGMTSTSVQCQNDQCIIGDPAPFNDFSHRSDAIAAWNTRTETEALRAEIARLKDEALVVHAAGEREGIRRAAEVAGAHRAPVSVPQIDYDKACSDVERAILALLPAQIEREASNG